MTKVPSMYSSLSAMTMAVELVDIKTQCGLTKPLSMLKVKDVPNLVKSIALYATVLKVKAALDQFMAGLKESGLLLCVQEYPTFFKDFKKKWLFFASKRMHQYLVIGPHLYPVNVDTHKIELKLAYEYMYT